MSTLPLYFKRTRIYGWWNKASKETQRHTTWKEEWTLSLFTDDLIDCLCSKSREIDWRNLWIKFLGDTIQDKHTIAVDMCILKLKYLLCCAKSLLLCPTLWDPTDYSPSGSSVHGILQARILEWVAISYSKGSSNPGMEPTSLTSPALAGGFFTTGATWEAPNIHFIARQFWVIVSAFYKSVKSFLQA